MVVIMSEHLEPEDFFDPELFIDTDYTSQQIVIGDICLEIKALHSASSTDYDLTGQILWPASKVLSLYLVQNPSILYNRSILELGAGVGLVGLVAAKLIEDAAKVILSDYQDTVLDVLSMNVNINFNHCQPRCALLCWGDKVDEFRDTYGTFDVLLGADVVFWPAACQPLFETAASLLSKMSESQFIISYINRSAYAEKLLFENARLQGFVWREVDLSSDPWYEDAIRKEQEAGRMAKLIIFRWDSSRL